MEERMGLLDESNSTLIRVPEKKIIDPSVILAPPEYTAHF